MYPFLGPPPPFEPRGFDPKCPFEPDSIEGWFTVESGRYRDYLERVVQYERFSRGLEFTDEMRGIPYRRLKAPAHEKTPRRKPANHNKRTRDLMVSQGWQFSNVEHYNGFSGRKSDFLGVFDAVATHPKKGTAGVQITSFENMSSRRHKMLGSKPMANWVRSGNRAYLIGWRRIVNASGKTLRYEPVVEPIHQLVTLP